MTIDVRAINDLVQRESAFIDPILQEVRKVVVGQDAMVERIVIGLSRGGLGFGGHRLVGPFSSCNRAKRQARSVQGQAFEHLPDKGGPRAQFASAQYCLACQHSDRGFATIGREACFAAASAPAWA